MNHVKRQNGVAQILMLGLVVLVIAVVGVAVWQAMNTNKKSSESPTPTVAASSSPAASATPVATPANEFKVTELGFKMTLPAGLTDLKYTAQTNSPGSWSDGTTYTLSTSRFSTNALQLQDARCAADNGPIGTIVRYSSDPQGRVTGVAAFKKVGSFFLGFETPQQSCSDKSAAGQLETSQIQLLRQAFDSATAL